MHGPGEDFPLVGCRKFSPDFLWKNFVPRLGPLRPVLPAVPEERCQSRCLGTILVSSMGSPAEHTRMPSPVQGESDRPCYLDQPMKPVARTFNPARREYSSSRGGSSLHKHRRLHSKGCGGKWAREGQVRISPNPAKINQSSFGQRKAGRLLVGRNSANWGAKAQIGLGCFCGSRAFRLGNPRRPIGISAPA